MDLFPPNGYGCRCEMVQYLGDKKAEKGSDLKARMYQSDPKYKDSQFEINRGDLKQVFTKKQFYSDIKRMPEKLNQMTFEKYGLPKWEDIKDKLKPISLDKTITGDNVKDLFKPYKDKDYMGFEDYLGRKMTLNKKVFDKHTVGKYLNDNELRHQIFPLVEDVLKNPDEVWHYDKKDNGQTFQSRYIKFYKDKVIIIECEFDHLHGLKINTWYSMKDEEKNIRKGLKIK